MPTLQAELAKVDQAIKAGSLKLKDYHAKKKRISQRQAEAPAEQRPGQA
jgi:hypothetical protein